MANIQIRSEGFSSHIDVDGVPLKGVVEANIRMEGGSLPVVEVSLFAYEHGINLQDGVLKVGALQAPEALGRAMLEHLKAKYDVHLPVVSMDMASGPDMTVAGRVAPDGRIVIVNNVTSQIADPASAIARAMTAEFVHRSKKPRNGGASSCLKGEDPMEATRALVKKHGGGSGG